LKDDLQRSGHNYCKVQKVDDIPAIPPTIADLQLKIDELQKQNAELQKRLLSLKSVKNSAETFNFYTNLPSYEVFIALSDYLRGRCSDRKTGMPRWKGYKTNKRRAKTALQSESERKFSFKEELFVVLVKLTTGRRNRDLAFNFGVSEDLISEIFNSWCCFLQFELKLLFEISDQTGELPLADCAAICSPNTLGLHVMIDCTQLILKKKTNLNLCNCAISNFENHETMKFLVSVSPNLYVNRVSTAWSELSNGLDRASQELAFSDELKQMGVEVILPSFNGRDWSLMEVTESTRSEQVVKSQISIERVVQRIRSFRILSSVITLNQTDLFERIFVICAYLTNFQLPID